MFEEVEHPSDLCLRAYGQDLEELFANAARGLFWLMECRPTADGEPVVRRVSTESVDCEALLVDWLSELLYLCERDDCCFSVFDFVTLTDTHLEANVRGTCGCPPTRGIKAVTYSDLSITQTEDAGLVVTITLDV